MATAEAAADGTARPERADGAVALSELVISLRGKDLLRVKGIVNVDGSPVVVQGVGHVFHPPVTLDRWPSEDRTSRIVFITRNMEAERLRALFEAVGGIGSSTPD